MEPNQCTEIQTGLGSASVQFLLVGVNSGYPHSKAQAVIYIVFVGKLVPSSVIIILCRCRQCHDKAQ